MKAAFLPDRGIIKIGGEDARHLLNGLVTSDVMDLQPGTAKFAALLTPQGKIIIDFLVTAGPDGDLLLDCPKALAPALATKLGFYKLRAKATIENLSDSLGVLAVWDGKPDVAAHHGFVDPRMTTLGWRILVPADQAENTAQALGAELADARAYDVHRICCGLPRGGSDFSYSDAFPHEANMDRLHGVDFDKGCYVGQEVVSRMQHRGAARTRIVRMIIDGPSPEPGIGVEAGGKPLGIMGSAADGAGIALLRIDRVADAIDAGLALTAGGISVRVAAPEDIRIAAKSASA